MFLLNDYENSYDHLLEKTGKSKIAAQNLRQTRFLCIEIYKTINYYLFYEKMF